MTERMPGRRGKDEVRESRFKSWILKKQHGKFISEEKGRIQINKKWLI